MPISKCNRCGGYANGTIKVVGDYPVEACTYCMADFNEWIRAQKVFIKFCALRREREDRLACMATRGVMNVSALCDIEYDVEQYLKLESELHNKAAVFFAPNLSAAEKNYALEQEVKALRDGLKKEGPCAS